ncbi:hypothetical protein FOE78_12500 [Microlunatus elymi]|uniref:Pilus assembly protein Flp/PilA n=1 Tax=Microlunatus elymi TaxID=2596828 RepID=A0A516PZQ4_9ACTN|nr:hypothetical protein [Microlunatus elymi]QDP96622.1 hypothetical protein FOE78_12500 [Microlunatus elymi]
MNKLIATLYAWTYVNTSKLRDRREAGQGTLEYVGMIAVAAVIVVAVIGVLKGAELGTWIQGFITNVKSSVSSGG